MTGVVSSPLQIPKAGIVDVDGDGGRLVVSIIDRGAGERGRQVGISGRSSPSSSHEHLGGRWVRGSSVERKIIYIICDNRIHIVLTS